jgi:hypothetical protein
MIQFNFPNKRRVRYERGGGVQHQRLSNNFATLSVYDLLG